MEREDIEAIAAIARENDILVLADEIYARNLYVGEHVSIASLPDMVERTIVLDGFSKTFAMTGWRLGYGIFPPGLIGPISKLVINSVSCTNAVTQMAAVEALNGPQDDVHAMIDEFKVRRDMVVAGLNQIPGIRCREPNGAFYVFPSVRSTGLSSEEFAEHGADIARRRRPSSSRGWRMIQNRTKTKAGRATVRNE